MRIELRDVSIGYDTGKPLAEHISCVFGPGEFSVVQGPSGSGKSSLLKTLNRLIEPQSGDIFVDNAPLDAYPAPKLRRDIAYIQQLPVLLEGSVRENLLLPFSFRSAQGLRRPDDAALNRHLEKLLLSGVSPGSSAPALSVGQKQRLCFIRALLVKPRYLLLDEPTSALDLESKGIMERWIEECNREMGTGIIMVTHQLYEPKNVPVRFYTLAGGRLTARKD